MKIQIIPGLKRGNQKALALLFEHYHKGMLYFAHQLVDNKEQAENFVASAFIKVWAQRNDFETLFDLRNFMYVSLYNSCLNYLKHIEPKTASCLEILQLSQNSDHFFESRVIKANLVQTALSGA